MFVVYQLIVFYLVFHFIWYLFRENKFWKRVSVVFVLIMFLLRLFLIK